MSQPIPKYTIRYSITKQQKPVSHYQPPEHHF